MKRTFLVLCFIMMLVVGCKKPVSQSVSSPEPESSLQTNTCMIKEQPCWKIVQALNQTEIVYPTENKVCDPAGKNLCTYKNPVLEEWGISVVRLETFRDGGSKLYKISDGNSQITIFVNHRIGSQEYGQVEISWPDKSGFTFDKEGHLIEQIPAADCVVGDWLCGDFVREINTAFKIRETVAPGLDKPIEQPDGRLLQRECKEEVCNYRIYDSELNILGLTPSDRYEENDIYTYHLPDGKKLIFNWQPDSPEHGFLTVVLADGSQKKFDYMGFEVKE